MPDDQLLAGNMCDGEWTGIVHVVISLLLSNCALANVLTINSKANISVITLSNVVINKLYKICLIVAT